MSVAPGETQGEATEAQAARDVLLYLNGVTVSFDGF